MTSWEPNQDELQQVLALLHHSTSSDTEVQRSVQQRLDQLNNHQQFCCYLVYILSSLASSEEQSRSLAGLILKNNIRNRWSQYPDDIKKYVQQETLRSIADSSQLVRATVGIIITTIVMEQGVNGWPDLLPTLKQMLEEEGNPYMQEGAMGAIQKVFEDYGDRLQNETAQPLMIPILKFFNSANAKMRGLAMSSFNSILMINNDPITPIIDQYLPCLFQRALDTDEEVQRQLCRSLCLLLDGFLPNLAPHFPNVIDYIIIKTGDPNETIALEACEFFLSLAENPDVCKPALSEVLSKLIPVLVKCMRYSEEDIILFKGNCDDDSMVPDREEDIKPRFHKAKEVGTGDDEDDDDDAIADWNIRRCSAASLDVLANVFRDELLPVILPIIKEALFHPEWEVKESGILALGAIAEGCTQGLVRFLPELVPFLLNMLQDTKPLVRSITCWTLSRFCSWVIDEAADSFFYPLLNGLLQRILDNNKKVQEAACSAFAVFEEEGGDFLIPYLPEIITTLVKAFSIYQARNLLILYDAVGTLAGSVGSAMRNPAYVQLLMPPLMEKWMRLGNDEKELFPLLECVSAIATSTGTEFIPYTEPVFNKCVALIEKSMEACIKASQHPDQFEMPDKDFLIVALDLLSGLAEGLSTGIEPLVANSNLIHLVVAAAMDASGEVRQSTFALFGDLVKTCWVHVKPYLSTFVPVLTLSFDVAHVSACNNAVWAFGEIAIRAGPELRPFVPPILPCLIFIMNKTDLQRTLLENTAITIGKLGIYCAEDVAPMMSHFIRNVCMSLRNCRDNVEKESAFRGLCTMININPQGLINDFIFWCDAIASFQTLKPDLKEVFIRILEAFRNHLGDENWNSYTSQFPMPLRERLANLYNI
ncbi:unnamed protein product [Auanema sp. JU1783]|nr:unnamed protein product [Auanema sp. JU1783]